MSEPPHVDDPAFIAVTQEFGMQVKEIFLGTEMSADPFPGGEAGSPLQVGDNDGFQRLLRSPTRLPTGPQLLEHAAVQKKPFATVRLTVLGLELIIPGRPLPEVFDRRVGLGRVTTSKLVVITNKNALTVETNVKSLEIGIDNVTGALVDVSLSTIDRVKIPHMNQKPEERFRYEKNQQSPLLDLAGLRAMYAAMTSAVRAGIGHETEGIFVSVGK